MPPSIDWPLQQPSRHRRRFWIVVAVLGLLVLGFRTALSFFVELLWFRSLGYGPVYTKMLTLEAAVFKFFVIVTFGLMFGAFTALKRAHLPNMPGSHTIFFGNQPLRLPVDKVMRLLAIGGSIAISLVTGAGMLAGWPKLALLFYANPGGGPVDPIFGRPLNFYLFRLPAYQLISGWLLTLAIVACVMACVFVVISGGAGAISKTRDFGHLPWRGLSVTFALLLLILAVRVYLDRYTLLFEDHTIFAGVTYTEAHLTLAGMLVVCIALIFGAMIAAANAFTEARGRWLVAAILPAMLCFLGTRVGSWWMSSFIVKPNELVREQPYIANNIRLTRQAWGLDNFTQREFPAETTVGASDPANNQATLQNIRLWDWRPLQDTLRQIQEIRTYYDFPDLDIDRYIIDGSLRQVLLGTRELNVDKLPISSRNWINEKLIYTHGYGITMNPVNGFTPEGLPTLYLSNMPVQSAVAEIKVTRPQIYFGELTNTDVYVKTRQQEFDYPQGQSNNLTSYQGTGGIALGGFLRRVLIALDRGDVGKLPFSDDIGPQSRLLMRRNVRDRVSALAPFLTFDSDPYMVVRDDGRLDWVMDAFTTSDQYPYSTHYRLGDDRINYMRNSVKVVVDAYDGSTDFYVFDENDPILAAYRSMFPSLFKAAAIMPADLRKHMRFPALQLEMQGEVYGLYHMTNPEVFYNREDLWTVATEVGMNGGGEQTTLAMQPNYVLMKLPNENKMEFVLILPFTPANRNNLIGWIGGRSDGDQYGKAIVYNFPKTRLVDGPLQIEARVDQNAQLSGQLTLWNQQGSHVRRGSLLVIPIGKALLYAEPIYLQAEHSPMPELRLVVLALQDRLVYGATYETALAALYGGGNSSLTAAEQQRANPVAGSSPSPEAPTIAEAARDLENYQRLTAAGKLGEAGQKLQDLKRVLDRLSTNQH